MNQLYTGRNLTGPGILKNWNAVKLQPYPTHPPATLSPSLTRKLRRIHFPIRSLTYKHIRDSMWLFLRPSIKYFLLKTVWRVVKFMSNKAKPVRFARLKKERETKSAGKSKSSSSRSKCNSSKMSKLSFNDERRLQSQKLKPRSLLCNSTASTVRSLKVWFQSSWRTF